MTKLAHSRRWRADLTLPVNLANDAGLSAAGLAKGLTKGGGLLVMASECPAIRGPQPPTRLHPPPKHRPNTAHNWTLCSALVAKFPFSGAPDAILCSSQCGWCLSPGATAPVVLSFQFQFADGNLSVARDNRVEVSAPPWPPISAREKRNAQQNLRKCNRIPRNQVENQAARQHGFN